MMKKPVRITIMLVCILAYTFSFASPAMAANQLDMTKNGSITVEIRNPDNGSLYPEQAVMTIHQIALLQIVEERPQFMATADYQDLNLDFALDNLTAAHVLEIIQAVQQRIKEQSLPVLATEKSTSGVFRFEDLQLGIYLLSYTSSKGELIVAPFLVTVPAQNQEKTDWYYGLTVYPKYVKPPKPSNPDPKDPPPPNPPPTDPKPTNPPKTPGRPEQIDELPTPQDTISIIPSRDVPAALMDPWPDNPQPDKLPQTGMVRWPILLLGVLGIIFFAAGWMELFFKRSGSDA